MISNLTETSDLMNSMDYKDRFKAEFYQLNIRIGKLVEMVNNWDNLTFVPTCSKFTYRLQLMAMKAYRYILKKRAIAENIEL